MEITAAVLTNESAIRKAIKKHTARFPSYMKTRTKKSFDELADILKKGLPIPPKFKPHKVSADEWEVHLVSRGSDVLIKFRWYVENGVAYIEFLKCTDHAKLNAQLLALAESDLLLDPEEVAQIEAMYKRLYG